MNLNKAIIVGRLTKDPELKKTQAGQSVCSFSMATNRTWTDKAGTKQEQSEFHNIVCWGRLAEIVAQFSQKGAELLVEGRLTTRSWDDKKGGGKRYTTEIVAESIQLGAKPKDGYGKAAPEKVSGAMSEREVVKPGYNHPEEISVIDLDALPPEEIESIPF